MKLKVQFIRSKGWPVTVRILVAASQKAGATARGCHARRGSQGQPPTSSLLFASHHGILGVCGRSLRRCKELQPPDAWIQRLQASGKQGSIISSRLRTSPFPTPSVTPANLLP